MKSVFRNSFLLLFSTLVIYGCDSGSEPKSKTPDTKKIASKNPSIQQLKLPPGESLNRTTKGFRNTTITMNTDPKSSSSSRRMGFCNTF